MNGLASSFLYIYCNTIESILETQTKTGQKITVSLLLRLFRRLGGQQIFTIKLVLVQYRQLTIFQENTAR
jgi:hypothetical protein